MIPKLLAIIVSVTALAAAGTVPQPPTVTHRDLDPLKHTPEAPRHEPVDVAGVPVHPFWKHLTVPVPDVPPRDLAQRGESSNQLESPVDPPVHPFWKHLPAPVSQVPSGDLAKRDELSNQLQPPVDPPIHPFWKHLPDLPTQARQPEPELRINPPSDSLPMHSTSQQEPRELTNGQRMAAGLPPRSPTKLRHQYSPRAPQPSARSISTVRTGYIRVYNASNEPLGYLGKSFNDVGEYGQLTTVMDQFLTVKIDSKDADGTDIITLNGPSSSFALLGAIQGFSSSSPDLGPDSYNYASLGGVSHTTSGSPPMVAPNSFSAATNNPESQESAIWTLQGDGTLTAQYINTDFSRPDTFVVFAPSDRALLLTGDVSAFQGSFGPDKPAVTLKFEDA